MFNLDAAKGSCPPEDVNYADPAAGCLSSEQRTLTEPKPAGDWSVLDDEIQF